MQASSTVEQLKGRLVSCLDEEHNVIDMPNLIIVLECLENAAVTKETLESTRLGFYVNDVRKRCQNSHPELSKKCRNIIKEWQKLLVGGQTAAGDASSAASSPASVASGASVTPRLIAQAQHPKFGGRVASSPGLALAGRTKLTPNNNNHHHHHHHHVINGHHAASATPSPSPAYKKLTPASKKLTPGQKTAGEREHKAGKFNSSYAPSPGSSTVTCPQQPQKPSPPSAEGAQGAPTTPSLKIRIKMGGVTKDQASIIKSASVPNNLQNGEKQSYVPTVNGSVINNGSSATKNSDAIFTTAVEHPGISTAKKSPTPVGQQSANGDNSKTASKDFYAASTSGASLTMSTVVVDAGQGSAPVSVKKPRQKRNLDKLNAEVVADPLALISQGCPLPKQKTTAALVAEMASVYPEEMARSITSAAAPTTSGDGGGSGSPPLPPSATLNLPPDGRRGSTQSGYTTPSVSPPQLELYGRYAKHDDYLDVTKSELVAQYLKTSAFSDRQTSPLATTSGLGGQWGEQQQPVVKKRGRPRKNAPPPSLLAYAAYDAARTSSPPVLTAAKIVDNKIYEPKKNHEQQQKLISDNDELQNKTKKRAKMKNWYEILPPLTNLNQSQTILVDDFTNFTNNNIKKTGLDDENVKKSIDLIDFDDKKLIKNVDKLFLDTKIDEKCEKIEEIEQNQRHKFDGFIDPCSIFNKKSDKNNNRALLDLHSRILMTLKKHEKIDKQQKIDNQKIDNDPKLAKTKPEGVSEDDFLQEAAKNQVLAMPYLDIGFPDFVEYRYPDSLRHIAHWSER